jgi:hypothetical protein
MTDDLPWWVRVAREMMGPAQPLASERTIPKLPCTHSYVLDLDAGDAFARCKLCGERLDAGE